MGRIQNQHGQSDNDVLDLSIVGDVEEYNRIQLERNLQDLSLQLSITNPSQASDNETNDYIQTGIPIQADYDEDRDETYSLEYPRHNSGANDISMFHGYDSSVMDRSHLTNDYDPHIYSHPTADIDDGNHIYGGDTLSTAAHHASALTLTAGLTGKGRRRTHVSDASMSGAEFDADRPLENIVNRMRKDLSMFDINSTRSHIRSKSYLSIQPSQAEPIVVDDTADLDDVLQNRDYFQEKKLSKGSLIHQSRPSAHVQSLPKVPQSPHQKLATVLHKVGNTFSPKRPRGGQHSLLSNASEDEPTPRAKPRSKNFNVAIQPPTPSTGSQFSKMARDLANDIQASHRHVAEATQLANDRILAHSTTKFSKQSKSPNVSKTREKVQLPDVTGLTSAVGTPLKARNEWQKYVMNNEDSDVERYFVRTLTALQTQLNQLESQNLVSRRRIRELELELEACKLEVKRERTRVLEREEIIVAQQKEVEKRRKGKEKAKRMDDAQAEQDRYKEVIEEKKALEALITTLRAHLTRLTAELSSHQHLLAELRVLRDTDQLVMQEKMSEVDKLRAEVERLGEEVEVLRGVVEQGLQERRRARENDDVYPPTSILINEEQPTHDDLSGAKDEFKERSCSVTPTPPSRPQSRLRQLYPDKTMRTDHATAGSSNLGASAANLFYDPNRSRYSSPDVDVDLGENEHSDRVQSSQEHSLSNSTSGRAQDQIEDTEQRLHPRVDHAASSAKISKQASREQLEEEDREPCTPFPQIRGERLERLFFSAPEHNARTCAVCHRRRRPTSPSEESVRVPWSRPQNARTTVHESAVEEQLTQDGNEDATQDVEVHERLQGVGPKRSEKKRVSIGENKLPPQTVLIRVLRDLEDDFTHYKGIYIELADQYKEMDAVSNVPKRNVLAEHLKEVIDTLERKGDQIAQLYDLLHFEDKPLASSSANASRNHEQSTLRRKSSGRRKEYPQRTQV